MKNNGSINSNPVFRVDSFDSMQQEIRKTIALMRKLDNIFKSLPTLTGKDDPQCTSAEDLYAQKEEAEEKLAKQLKYISSFKDTIQDLVDKQKKKLESLSIDKTSIKYEKAVKKYSFSIYLQEEKTLKTVTLQKEFCMVMDSGTKAIELSKNKKFPLGKPKRKPPIYRIGPFHPQPNEPSPIMSDMPANQPIPPIYNNPIIPPIPAIQPISPVDNHINNLVSIGPLGK